MVMEMCVQRVGICLMLLSGLCGVARAEPDERASAAVTPASHAAPATGGAASGAESFDRSRMVRELMRRRGGDPAAAAQLIQLSRGFSAPAVAELFETLALAHEAKGNVNLAAETRLMLVQFYPEQPRAAESLVWLTRLYASSEAALAHQPSGERVSRDAQRGTALYAYQLADGIEGVPAACKAESALVFQRAVAARRGGMDKRAGTLLAPLKHGRAGDPWGDCARAEEWLTATRRGAPPKPVGRCVPAREPPHLDGVLDEACWQGDASLRMQAADADEAVVRLAYDEEFLYLAVECPRIGGVDYAKDAAPRTHDADLSQRDRVTVVLDADRDYATGFELTVDSRGWTNDRCWGDAAWNPEWFVTTGEGAGAQPQAATWTAEAAIPWTALTSLAPQAGEAWACGARREAPGIEARSWAGGEKPVAGPAGFGLLLFE
jgi:hypothetical protein